MTTVSTEEKKDCDNCSEPLNNKHDYCINITLHGCVHAMTFRKGYWTLPNMQVDMEKEIHRASTRNGYYCVVCDRVRQIASLHISLFVPEGKNISID